MIVSNDFDPRVAYDLAIQIDNLTHKDPNLTQHEIFNACLIVIREVLAAIQCPDCRAVNVKILESEFPRMIEAALAAEIDADTPHIH